MDIYQHFRKDEQPFIDQVLSWKDDVETMYQSRLTNFLNPREQKIIETLIGKEHDVIHYDFFGGHSYAERKRALIVPFYESLEVDRFQTTVLEAKYHTKFAQIEHPDILGSFLGLGIDRKKIGEIVVSDGIIQIVIASEIAPYVQANFTQIRNTKVNFSEVPHDELRLPKLNWKEKAYTASSLRLDAFISEVYKLSRKISQELISKKYVKVNFKVIEDSKYILNEGDMLSVRGKGRSQLDQINGRTKKDRIRFTASILQ